MPEPVWLGLDLGTQSARAIAVSDAGDILASASEPFSSQRDGVRHTQLPEDWWSAVVACCRKVTATLDGRPVTALSIDATSGTMLLTNDRLNPLSDALMYDDGRAHAESSRINAAGQDFWAEMGYQTQRSWALPKLLWLIDQQPSLRSTGRLTHQNDFIHARLAGKRLASDSSHSLKSGYDLLHSRWPLRLQQSLDLPASLFPEVVPPGTLIGEVSRAAAEATGLTPGCRIIAGMTDGCAAQVAAGAIEQGDWNSVIGTTLVLKGASRERILDPLGVVYSHRSPNGMWLPGGASSVGAGMITTLFPGADLDALNAAAGALGVPSAVMYPLAGSGERFPFIAPAAQAFTLGSPQNQVEEYAAVLSGVACIERLCFDYLQLIGAPVGDQISITGGAVKSDTWNRMRATVLGRRLRVPASTEAAFGSAVLAASPTSSLDAAAQRMVRTQDVIHPTPADAPAYRQLYFDLVNALAERGWIPPALATTALAT